MGEIEDWREGRTDPLADNQIWDWKSAPDPEVEGGALFLFEQRPDPCYDLARNRIPEPAGVDSLSAVNGNAELAETALDGLDPQIPPFP